MPGAGFLQVPGLTSPAPIGVPDFSCFLPRPISLIRNGTRIPHARIKAIAIPHASEKWNDDSIAGPSFLRLRNACAAPAQVCGLHGTEEQDSGLRHHLIRTLLI